MYRLPNGRTIKQPEQIIIDGILYPKTIFSQWSLERLNNIGIYPIIEQKYNSKRYKIQKTKEKIINGSIYIIYELKEKDEFLESYKRSKYNEININRKNTIESGIEYMNHVWDSDETSRNNLMGAVLGVSSGVLLPDSENGYVIKWRTSDNQDIDLTAEQLIGLSTAMLNHVNTSYIKSWKKKSLISSCNTVEEIDSIEINNM